MSARSWFSLAAAVLLCVLGVSRASAEHPEHEIWLGAGGAASPEKTIFNLVSDIESVPEAVFSFGYMKNLDDRRAIGVHFYGAGETTPVVALIGPSGTTSTAFDLATINVGVRYRQVFTRAGWLPYAFVGFSVVSGSIESAPTGNLTCSGFSACLGPGAGIELGRNFMLSAELIASFGTAQWKETPFLNSSGRNFDPSLLGGTINLSVVWGRTP